uniref:DUF6824 domain-containing protein n=1 Tax=Cyclophora tenuis TaxID=216820 RepID=A0A7S1GN30_CYCTE
MNNNLMLEAQRRSHQQQQALQQQMSQLTQQQIQQQQQQPQDQPQQRNATLPQTPEESRMALLNTIGDANSLLLGAQQPNLTFTTQDAAQRAVMEVLARHNTVADAPEGEGSEADPKRKREPEATRSSKKAKVEESDGVTTANNDDSGPAPVPPSEEGLSYFNDNDVLSGRGGGTNVHPGNRHFRDLINLHRRAYLKARKNDKPAISRAIVRSIRENNGRFLKRDEKTGLWYEIGDDAAREKTSQALRQRAPEMRKILFESEREQARQEAEEQLRQQQHLITAGLAVGTPSDITGLSAANLGALNPAVLQQGANPMLNPLLAMQMNKNLSGQMPLQQDPYSQMSQNLMTAALLGGGINRFTPNGA